jgi:hypothetical protein
MLKYLPLAAVLLAGCAGMSQENRGAAITLGVFGGAALLAVMSSDDDETPECTRVIRPSAGGRGLSTDATVC